MMFRRRRKRLAPGEFPEHVTRAYVRHTLPSATPSEAKRTVEHLRGQGWSDEKLAQFVLPYMPPEPTSGPETVHVPVPVSRHWLDDELPGMTPTQIRLVVVELERRGWAPRDTALAVLPHLLPKLPDADALAIVGGLKRLGLSEHEVERIAHGRR